MFVLNQLFLQTEISVETDPTLAETLHPGINSTVQCVVAHWSSEMEVIFPQQHDPNNRTRFALLVSPLQ